MIAGAATGARVTIRGMTRTAVVLLIALLSACAGPQQAPDDGAVEAQAEALADLEVRVADLESELEATASERERSGERLDALGDRLDKALERLRAALDNLRSATAGAGDDAASAMATAHSAAAALDVLEERYEYHLRRYHGGG